MGRISEVREILLARIAESDAPRGVLRANELRELYAEITALPAGERGAFGREINTLKQELESVITTREAELESVDLRLRPPTDQWSIARCKGDDSEAMRSVSCCSDQMNGQ